MILKKALKTIPLVIPELIFLSSLVMPAIEYNRYGKVEHIDGLLMLLMSPFGLFVLNFAGLANVTLVIGRVVVATKPLVSMALSFISLLLAMSFLLYEKMPMGSEGSYVFKVSFGYYAWLGSMVAAFIHAAVIYENKKNT